MGRNTVLRSLTPLMASMLLVACGGGGGSSGGGTTSTPGTAPTTVSSKASLYLLAGSTGGYGSLDGTGVAARFNAPQAVAVDGSGNVFVADTNNNTIREVSSAGVVTTFAGQAGVAGSSDGTGSAALFNSPQGVAVDANGNVYVADTGNNTIRKISAAGAVTTLAGQAGVAGSADGTGAAASLSNPFSVAVDASGNIFVADYGNSTIRKITTAGVVSTYAGTAGTVGSTDGTGAAASFNYPEAVAVDGSGNVYVADYGNDTIRKIAAGGVVSTFAGHAGVSGSADGTGTAATFNAPQGVSVDTGGNVYVADTGNATVRKITPAQVVSTFAGLAGTTGSADGSTAARFDMPMGLGTDSAGNVYVADSGNNTVRKISNAGAVTTLAGAAAVAGSSDGTGSAASFNGPFGVAVDKSGNVYVADHSNSLIRAVTPAGVVTTLAGQAGVTGSTDGTGTAASFNQPEAVAVDSSGNLYIADSGNNTIRKMAPGGIVTTLAGQAGVIGSADGAGTAASFNMPEGIAVDSNGNIYVADAGNDTIRKITATGTVTTLAGQAGVAGSADGTGSGASFNNPTGIAVAADGTLFVSDTANNTVRKITTTGTVSTVAGTAGATGNADGNGAAARFNNPAGIARDSNGNLYVADYGNGTIRTIAANGQVATLLGMPGIFDIRLGSSPLPGPAVGIAVSGTMLVYSASNAVLAFY